MRNLGSAARNLSRVSETLGNLYDQFGRQNPRVILKSASRRTSLPGRPRPSSSHELHPQFIAARGALHYASPELARELRIPNMEKPGQFLWPPPTVSSELLAAIPTDPFIIAEAAKGAYENARYKRLLEDNRRQIAEAEQRQREFEKQQAAEAEAAKERDRQAYRERGRPV